MQKIDIVYYSPEDLIPDPKNPRRNDGAVNAVMESIKEFGFRVPIVVDKDGIIRAGHTRYKAAVELGLTRIPCVVAKDLTEKQLKAFQLADNKTGELATWDMSMLNLEMTDLAELFDMSLFGFNKKPNTDAGSTGGDAPTAKSQYITCPRCGRMFLKSEGHPKEKVMSGDEFLEGGDDE